MESTRKIQNYLAADKRAAFLQALRQCALNITQASREAGLSTTSAIYQQRQIDPEFAAQWQAVEDELLDDLEARQWKDARERPEDRRWVLARRRPNRWAEKRAIAMKGEVRHYLSVQDMTEGELEALLAAHQLRQALEEEEEKGLLEEGDTPDV